MTDHITTVLTSEMRAEMRKSAEAATPGQWFTCDFREISSQPTVRDISVSCAWPDYIGVCSMENALTASVEEAVANAAHIAAACPAAVLALLDERDRLERERDEARAIVSDPSEERVTTEELRSAVDHGYADDETFDLLDARAALAAERERSRVLAEALEPFGTVFNSEAPNDQGIGLRISTESENPTLQAADFRRAATALRRYKDGEKATE